MEVMPSGISRQFVGIILPAPREPLNSPLNKLASLCDRGKAEWPTQIQLKLVPLSSRETWQEVVVNFVNTPWQMWETSVSAKVEQEEGTAEFPLLTACARASRFE